MDNLYFIGLLQPLGAMMSIAEKQGKLVAAHIAGDIAFPGRETPRGMTLARGPTPCLQRGRSVTKI